MTKIGLFLNCKRSIGGVFQYSCAILEALASLPKDQYSITVVYTDGLWQGVLREYPQFFSKDFSVSSLDVLLERYVGLLFAFLAKIHSLAPFLYKMYRFIASRFHSLPRGLPSCDLWVFTKQELLSWAFPLKTLSPIHDLMHRYETKFKEYHKFGLRSYRDFVCGGIASYAAGILVDSELGAKHVRESYCVSDKTRLCVLPYIPPNYIYEETPVVDVRQKYNLPEKFLFYPAQFWEHKNHIGLLQALLLLRPQEINIVFVGSKYEGYTGLIKNIEQCGMQNNVFVLDYVDNTELKQLYRECVALIMPTFIGPTNIPPLEAFVLGCPVATSRIYGIPEQLGNAALYFNPNSADEMAVCIDKLWNDHAVRNMLIKNGARHAATWNQTAFAERLRSIIEELNSNIT